MQEAQRLADELRETIGGDPWFGSPVRALLEGVDEESAAARPIAGAHTIRELVRHMTSWAREAARRVAGGEHGTPKDGDWPQAAAARPGELQASLATELAALARAHDELAAAVAKLDDAALDRQVAGGQVDARGAPVTLRRTLVGVLQHTAYHAGQIALLRKLAAA